MVNISFLDGGVFNLLRQKALDVLCWMKDIAENMRHLGFTRHLNSFFLPYRRKLVQGTGRFYKDNINADSNKRAELECDKNDVRDSLTEDGKRIPETFSESERRICLAHKKAVEAEEDTYKDPETGYDVFTKEALLKKDECCGCACRHCPYGHANVPEALRTRKFNSLFYM